MSPQDLFLTPLKFNPAARLWSLAESSEAPFGYSDGDEVEQRLLAIVRATEDRATGSPTLNAAITDFASSYHLSPLRANLLRPVAEHLRGTVLELGAGCGAITRFLGEQGGTVVAVEGSSRRAEIAAARCADLANVSVITSRIQDLEPRAKFDVVTLIGVLEYARVFGETGEDPVQGLLSRARGFLKPGGILLVAIENQLGLKYFALYPEDHLGEPTVGIEGRYGATTAVTYGRRVLSVRLESAGLGSQVWYHPFPDYKFPTLVLQESGCTQLQSSAAFGWALAQTGLQDPQRPEMPSFSMQRVWPTLLENQLVGELSNSLLVLASDGPVEVDRTLLAEYYGGVRQRQLQKVTSFVREGQRIEVRRRRTYPSAPAPDPMLGFTLEDEPLIKGEVLEARLVAVLGRAGWSATDLLSALEPWFAAFRAYFGASATDQPAERVPARAIDALPRNLVVLPDGQGVFIDQEWRPPGELTTGFVFFRALLAIVPALEWVAEPASEVDLGVLSLIRGVFAARGWPLDEPSLRQYIEQEREFQSRVSGVAPARFAEQLEAMVLPRRGRLVSSAAVQVAQEQLAAARALNDRQQRELEDARRELAVAADALRTKTEECVAYEARLAALTSEAEQSATRLRDIEGSTIWRSTAGLRATMDSKPRLRALARRLLHR